MLPSVSTAARTSAHMNMLSGFTARPASVESNPTPNTLTIELRVITPGRVGC